MKQQLELRYTKSFLKERLTEISQKKNSNEYLLFNITASIERYVKEIYHFIWRSYEKGKINSKSLQNEIENRIFKRMKVQFQRNDLTEHFKQYLINGLKNELSAKNASPTFEKIFVIGNWSIVNQMDEHLEFLGLNTNCPFFLKLHSNMMKEHRHSVAHGEIFDFGKMCGKTSKKELVFLFSKWIDETEKKVFSYIAIQGSLLAHY